MWTRLGRFVSHHDGSPLDRHVVTPKRSITDISFEMSREANFFPMPVPAVSATGHETSEWQEGGLCRHDPSQDRLHGRKPGIFRFPDYGQELEPEIVVSLVEKRPHGAG